MTARTIIAAALLALSTPAGAQATTCAKIEFAEMDAMSKEELLRLRCETRETTLAAIKAYGAGGRSSAIGQCADELVRQERILARKYALGDDPKEARRQIRAMCGEPPPQPPPS